MKLNELTYDFEIKLKKKQMELALNNVEFAKHIGMHKTWLMNLWNQKQPRHPLSEKTMYLLHNNLGMDFETMVNYNQEIISQRGE